MEFRRAIVCILGAFSLAPFAGGPLSAQVVFTVDSALDEIDDDTSDGVCATAAETCTLRAAVMQANLSGGLGAIIELPAGTYTLTRPPSGGDGPDVGDLNLLSPAMGDPPIVIAGAGAARTIVEANDQFRVFSVHPFRTARFSGVTIRRGYVSGFGGGLYNRGRVAFESCRIAENQATDGGGGIYSEGVVRLTDSTLAENVSEEHGGGIWASGGAEALTLVRSTIEGNVALAGSGGGVLVTLGGLTAVEATVSGNSASGHGGGIYFGSSSESANVYNSSVLFNGADSDGDFLGNGGGISAASSSVFSLRNSLVARNYLHGAPVPSDCSGTVGSYGRNLFGSADGCTILTATGSWSFLQFPESVGPLASNGGPTRTHALLTGSDAVDAGDPALGCIDGQGAIAVDQRGAPRALGVRCDVGAYEAGTLFFDGFESGEPWETSVGAAEAAP